MNTLAAYIKQSTTIFPNQPELIPNPLYRYQILLIPNHKSIFTVFDCSQYPWQTLIQINHSYEINKLQKSNFGGYLMEFIGYDRMKYFIYVTNSESIYFFYYWLPENAPNPYTYIDISSRKLRYYFNGDEQAFFNFSVPHSTNSHRIMITSITFQLWVSYNYGLIKGEICSSEIEYLIQTMVYDLLAQQKTVTLKIDDTKMIEAIKKKNYYANIIAKIQSVSVFNGQKIDVPLITFLYENVEFQQSPDIVHTNIPEKVPILQKYPIIKWAIKIGAMLGAIGLLVYITVAYLNKSRTLKQDRQKDKREQGNNQKKKPTELSEMLIQKTIDQMKPS